MFSSLITSSFSGSNFLGFVRLSPVTVLIPSIEFGSLIFSAEGLELTLSKLRKTQRKGPITTRRKSRLQDPKICSFETVRAYIQATYSFRNPFNSSVLLIGSVKPHKPVTGSTVGHWISKVLEEAWINTNIFSTHSTRGAAASKAAFKRIPTDSILKIASWANESTFVKFYRREIPQPDTGATILAPSQSNALKSPLQGRT